MKMLRLLFVQCQQRGSEENMVSSFVGKNNT